MSFCSQGGFGFPACITIHMVREVCFQGGSASRVVCIQGGSASGRVLYPRGVCIQRVGQTPSQVCLQGVGQTPPPEIHGILRDMVSKRAVRILYPTGMNSCLFFKMTLTDALTNYLLTAERVEPSSFKEILRTSPTFFSSRHELCIELDIPCVP